MKNVNRFENTSDDGGFFKEYFKNFKNSVTEDQLKDFESLKTDEDRVRFVHEITIAVGQLPIELLENGKSEENAKILKEKGNKEFGRNDNRAALQHYSDSILETPFNESSNKDIAVTLANRSAALYHLNEYEMAIKDIDWVLTLNYPQELRYKVLERKAKCLLALRRHQEALAEFRKALQALDDCKLPAERKSKLQTDIQIMLGIMSKPKTKAGHINMFLEGIGEAKNKEKQDTPKLCSPRNKVYEAGCDKIDILENETVGRYCAATSTIDAGDTLLIEKAFCSVLLAEHMKNHCLHCFVRPVAPYPCQFCSNVVFCSEECRDAALNSYHKYECKIIGHLFRSGASIMVYMALRIISQKPLSFFLEVKEKLQETRKKPEKYQSLDYLSVYHLVRHKDQRQRNDFLERSLMALFLLQCLRKVDYFGTNNQDDSSLTNEQYFIGGLILRHLQLLQFNAHEIFELEAVCVEQIDKSQSVFIGGGLYPTLALFNHSCNPGVVRYFNGTTVVVRAIKPISEGETISENYGPMFTLSRKEARQQKLKSQYWFTCECKACCENWPTFEEMDKKVMRFRCDSRGENNQKISDCKGVITVPIDGEEFMVTCKLCKQQTNILKGLKVLQDTDAMFKQASRDTDRGNYKSALNIYLEILCLLDEILAPPYPDYHLCQQAIRKCMLTLGNKYVKDG